MNGRLLEILSSFLPAYQYQIPASANAAIAYQPIYAADVEYESGKAITEQTSYRITIFQRQPKEEVVKGIVEALRNEGWHISEREWLIDTEGKYYQHSIDIDKWEGIR